MRLQARQIEAFRAVMLTGGMTAAAETLYITQPAVSRLVKDLELALGLTLFHRRGNQLTPTAEAVDLLAEVQRSYLGLEFIERHASDLRDAKRGSLRVAAHPAMALSFLPNYVASFAGAHPGLSIILDGIPSHLVLERVAGGQFDIGFATFPPERPSLKIMPIPATAVVIMRGDHRLATRTEVVAADLAGERIVLLARGDYSRHTIEVALGSAANIQKIETPLSAIACAFVAEGLGITVTDPFSAVPFVERGIVARRFVPAIDVGAALIVASDRQPSRVAVKFMDGIRPGLDRYLAPLGL